MSDQNRMAELMAWYREAQDHVLSWLSAGPDDDTLDNNIVAVMQRPFALWCLAHNLRTAAGLMRAHLLGHNLGVFRPLKTDSDVVKAGHAEMWRPGCGRPAPGWGGGE